MLCSKRIGKLEITIDFEDVIQRWFFLFCYRDSTVVFVEGASNSYLGYVTLKFCPDLGASNAHQRHYCLEIKENCAPTVHKCVIRSLSTGELVKLFFSW